MTARFQEDLLQFWSARDIGARLLDVATASHARAIAFLVLISLVSFLPGFFNTPPIDRDEARFAQATKQMIESKDYVDIRFQDEVRYKKPVGIYWLQATAVRIGQALGVPDALTTIWLYRIPSLIGAVGAVLMTYWMALALGSRRTAYLAGVMLACSILLGIEARLAKTDAMLLLTVVAAMGAMARTYLRNYEKRVFNAPAWLDPAVFWTALAAGILLKGPLILMVMGLAVISLVVVDRSAQWLRDLRPVSGILWMLVLVLPWFAAIFGRTGESFFAESAGRDLVGKVLSAAEGHGAPPGYYLLLFWVTFWPAAPLAALAVPAVWSGWREPATRFLLAWLVPAWIVFELVMTKLPHYVLPLYPAIALLTARTIARGELSENRRLRPLTTHWPIIALLGSIGGMIALAALRKQLGLLAWPFAGAAIVFAFFAWRFYDEDGAERSFMRAALAAMLMGIAVLGVDIPLLRPLFPSAAFASMFETRCADPQFAAAGYHEPSLVFLLGTSTRLTDGYGAADFLLEGPCRFALIEARQERSFVQRAEAIGLRYAPGVRLEGINYNGGRAISIAVYRSEGPL
jgi:4-amino-4-deoxy-L-arabinose transferase-like glycosyltransferase